ncbi:FtsX-like permease family protein [Psychrobacillus sp. OK032]|uniref:FtsX-like permease family protein n=1 Tax=Psychrobacillus sp. OK032 TaxID=1884358 RepID=UPI0008B647EE|nr:ABC transporter permease [Psychrobacillus sp. OK032]SES19424.1 putative ABC transport system permease protein [Psychrobacillus sp. OK032]
MTFQQFAYHNVIRNSRIYAAFFMASIFSVMVFFVYSMLMFHPNIEDQFLRDVAFGGMLVAQVILIVFTMFFLFYSMSAFLQARLHEFGVLLNLGMERQQLNRLIFLETMILGFISITIGIFFGFSFSKFFFMIIRELFLLDSLPLYLSWKPFALTIIVFLSQFIIISISSVVFIRKKEVVQLIKGDGKFSEVATYKKGNAFLGLGLLVVAYSLVIFSVFHMNIFMSLLIIFMAIIGTYFFYTDSMLYILDIIRRKERLYWHSFRLIAFAEASIKIRENARMFFVVTIVSTIAFLSVGVVTSFTSFTAQYRELNPVSIFYASDWDNPFEEADIMKLSQELQREGLSYELVKFNVKKQTSSNSHEPVNVIKESEVNSLAVALKIPLIDLNQGEALLVSSTQVNFDNIRSGMEQTVLEESSIPIQIKGMYKHPIFPSFVIKNRAFIISDEDFSLLTEPLFGFGVEESKTTFFAFHVSDWLRTKDVGTDLDKIMTETMGISEVNPNPFYFVNPGLNFSVIRATFALLLFTGLLVAAVLLLAAGSFVYFKLYTDLDRDKKQYDVLRRMGVTDQELVKIVNRQLVPQFFLPWGLAMVHSTFSFIFLQAFWVDLAAVSIAMEMLIVLIVFTVIQVSYFFLIRWRYIAHIQE